MPDLVPARRARPAFRPGGRCPATPRMCRRPTRARAACGAGGHEGSRARAGAGRPHRRDGSGQARRHRCARGPVDRRAGDPGGPGPEGHMCGKSDRPGSTIVPGRPRGRGPHRGAVERPPALCQGRLVVLEPAVWGRPAPARPRPPGACTFRSMRRNVSAGQKSDKGGRTTPTVSSCCPAVLSLTHRPSCFVVFWCPNRTVETMFSRP